MNFGVVTFPGTWSDADFRHVLADVLGQPVRGLWHRDTDLRGLDCVILPGGFAFGDYLRAGAVAARSPIMGAVREFAAAGGLVLGSCNGFQVLCEAGLLPGALMRNECLQYRCQPVTLRVETVDTPFTRTLQRGELLTMPISHGEGRFHADPDTLRQLTERGQVVFRYATPGGRCDPAANPNGSLESIAGIANEAGTVLGLMPHPERAAEAEMGGTDGLRIFHALLGRVVEQGHFASR
jgi:phosphoribosylformylglycinamidine synthase